MSTKLREQENCLNDFYSVPFDAQDEETEHIYQTLDEAKDAGFASFQKKFNYHRRSIHVMLRFNAADSHSSSDSSSSTSTSPQSE